VSRNKGTANSTVGVIATHEEYPIERMKLDRNGRWLGSVSHDLCIKLTDVQDLFEDSDGEDEEMTEDQSEAESDAEDQPMEGVEEESDSDDEVEVVREKKKKKGKAGMGDLGRGEQDQKENNTFFSDL
jgi:hypothetical protein